MKKSGGPVRSGDKKHNKVRERIKLKQKGLDGWRPVAPLETSTEPSPNSRCPCGSEKKYKKCCKGA